MNNRATEIKVGIFLLAALCVGGIMIFVIGSANQQFDQQVSLHSSFERVSGLKVGSMVMLAGLKIGVVDQIELSQAKREVNIRMKVLKSVLGRIREDSNAFVQGKGLLGDAIVDISMGSKGEAAKPDGTVKGVTPKGLSDIMAEGGVLIESLKRSLFSVEQILEQYRDPTLSRNLKGIVTSIDDFLARTRKGPGLLHDIIYSRVLALSLRGTLEQLQRLTRNLAATAGEVNVILHRARRPGTLAHQLLISQKGAVIATDFQRVMRSSRSAIDSLNQILQAPQQKGTLLHSVLYEKDSSRLASNLVRATDDLRTIMRDIRVGKGTLGAIINDPTAFEDFKTILGQVKRSRIFRSLIRFIIKRNDDTVNKAGQVENK